MRTAEIATRIRTHAAARRSASLAWAFVDDMPPAAISAVVGRTHSIANAIAKIRRHAQERVDAERRALAARPALLAVTFTTNAGAIVTRRGRGSLHGDVRATLRWTISTPTDGQLVVRGDRVFDTTGAQLGHSAHVSIIND